jgi:hypothetical protein
VTADVTGSRPILRHRFAETQPTEPIPYRDSRGQRRAVAVDVVGTDVVVAAINDPHGATVRISMPLHVAERVARQLSAAAHTEPSPVPFDWFGAKA